LVVFAGPLIKFQMAFDEVLLTFAKILLDHVSQLSAGLAVKGLHVDKHGVILPLAGLRILPLIVNREAERGHLASGGETSHFRIARQSTNQHHFVQIRHNGCLPGDEPMSKGDFPMTFRSIKTYGLRRGEVAWSGCYRNLRSSAPR